MARKRAEAKLNAAREAGAAVLIVAAAPGQFLFFEYWNLRVLGLSGGGVLAGAAPRGSRLGKHPAPPVYSSRLPCYSLLIGLTCVQKTFASIPRQWPGAAECRLDDSCRCFCPSCASRCGEADSSSDMLRGVGWTPSATPTGSLLA